MPRETYSGSIDGMAAAVEWFADQHLARIVWVEKDVRMAPAAPAATSFGAARPYKSFTRRGDSLAPVVEGVNAG